MASVMKHGLAIVYHEWGDPIFTTTVLPFLKALKARHDIENVFVMTFESQNHDEIERETLHWIPQKKSSGSFLVFRKLSETLKALWRCRKLKKVDYIISAGLLSGSIASVFSTFLKVPFGVLTFEPHADYMVDMRRWKKHQLKTIILRFFERRIDKTALTLFATTNAKFNELNIKQRKLLPSCVDLATFRFKLNQRIQIRRQLKIADEAIVFVYLGKFGGLYFDDAFFEQMSQLLVRIPGAQLLIISQSCHQKIYTNLKRYQLEHRAIVLALPHRDVSNYLSAADIGITGIPSKPSMQFRSPIKNGEYWACGLPILISEGVGDDWQIAKEQEVGVVIKRDDAWCEMVPDILALLQQPRDRLRQRCRVVAETYRSLEKGVGLIKEYEIP